MVFSRALNASEVLRWVDSIKKTRIAKINGSKYVTSITEELIEEIEAALLSAHGLPHKHRQTIEAIRNELQASVETCKDLLEEPDFKPVLRVFSIGED